MPIKSGIYTNHSPITRINQPTNQPKITNYAKQTQFPGRQMSLTIVKISCYENVGLEKQSQNKAKTKPIQSQSNPNQSQNKPDFGLLPGFSALRRPTDENI